MLAVFNLPLSWGELLKRTVKDAREDDCLGLAAQLAHYPFLALFPTVLFLLALVSLLPITDFIDDVMGALGAVAPAEVLVFLDEQLRRVANSDSGGILTIGTLGAMSSSSATAEAGLAERPAGAASAIKPPGDHRRLGAAVVIPILALRAWNRCRRRQRGADFR